MENREICPVDKEDCEQIEGIVREIDKTLSYIADLKAGGHDVRECENDNLAQREYCQWVLKTFGPRVGHNAV